MLVCGGIKSIAESHVGVKGIIAGARLLLRHGVVERDAHLRLVGEELSEFERGGDGVLLLGVGRTLHHTILQTAEAIADITAREVHHTEVGELYVHRSRGGPSAVVVGVEQSQFVHPYLTRLHLAGDVSHTDHHHLNLTQCGVTHHTHLVGGTVWVGGRIESCIGGGSRRLCDISGFLDSRKNVEIDKEHVRLRPHHLPVGRGIFAIIAAVGRQLQGNLIFVVVVLVITTQTDEHGELAVL